MLRKVRTRREGRGGGRLRATTGPVKKKRDNIFSREHAFRITLTPPSSLCSGGGGVWKEGNVARKNETFAESLEMAGNGNGTRGRHLAI